MVLATPPILYTEASFKKPINYINSWSASSSEHVRLFTYPSVLRRNCVVSAVNITLVCKYEDVANKLVKELEKGSYSAKDTQTTHTHAYITKTVNICVFLVFFLLLINYTKMMMT